MLVVNIELWPGGDSSRAKCIGSARISNISKLADISDYEYTLRQTGSRFAGPIAASGTIRAHDRSQGPWRLVLKMIAQAIEARRAETAEQAPCLHESAGPEGDAP